MADVTLSGYKAAAAAVVFSGTQKLVSLQDNEWTDLSDAIDNSTNKYMFADLELVLGSAAFTGLDSAMELFLVPSVDGTNYADWTGNLLTDVQHNNIHFIGSVATSGSTQAQRLTLRGVALPAGLYKYGVRNRGGVTLAASGNTLSWRPYQYSSA